MRVLALAAFLIGLPATAFAGGGFDIVVPGRPGVPIIINNIDASYSVVEGVWGLGKNVQVQPTIYGGRYVAERQPDDVGHYYPTLGLRPGYGRLEVEPPANRKLPKPAESYHESWSARSAPLPAQMDVPVNPPPVILAPEFNDTPRYRQPR
ncbi:hypothetical protein [Bradyrhizobium betae]|uniref:Uncharacterized protein n=1 Tax=Bradyrhizobium betae TaxID=244734 RepID=A0A5P6PCF8_9BRAD|nr:hypothetical protein [Bradyrhizobium betae]MCS3729728.1 hypothetical protein [Bradyrhizobium betae]QFI76047.1 hypothetical protein F8237_28805 [Bradyrhizobium betae]